MRNQIVNLLKHSVRMTEHTLDRWFPRMGGGAYDAQFSLGLAHSAGAQLEPQWDWETETSAEPAASFPGAGALENLFEQAIWLAVPKSKISYSRKRMKHLQHVPNAIGWSTCQKCGEAKRPHRICTKNKDICAMRDDEYTAHKAKQSDGVVDGQATD